MQGAEALLVARQRAVAELGVAVSEDVARFQPSVLITTPSSALRLEQAESLRIVMVTGEPGGSIGACRRLIEGRGGARCVDVYALHELGVVGWSCPERSDCLHLDDHALRRKLGAAGRATVEERFDLRRSAEELAGLFGVVREREPRTTARGLPWRSAR